MNAPNQSGWRPEMTPASEDGLHNGPSTLTGNRALMLEEPLLFEIGRAEVTGVDLPEPRADAPNRLAGLGESLGSNLFKLPFYNPKFINMPDQRNHNFRLRLDAPIANIDRRLQNRARLHFHNSWEND